jgi:predicted nucleic acid-binding protein
LAGDPPAKLIVRRDLKDNPVLALAIAQRAAFLVTHDLDFLDLETPYGVQCVTPRAFIRHLLGAP